MSKASIFNACRGYISGVTTCGRCSSVDIFKPVEFDGFSLELACEYVLVVVEYLHGDVEFERHECAVAFVELFYGCVFEWVYEPVGCFSYCAFFCTLIVHIVVVFGVDEFVCEGAFLLPVVKCVVEQDGVCGVIIVAHFVIVEWGFYDVEFCVFCYLV